HVPLEGEAFGLRGGLAAGLPAQVLRALDEAPGLGSNRMHRRGESLNGRDVRSRTRGRHDPQRRSEERRVGKECGGGWGGYVYGTQWSTERAATTRAA